MANKHPFDQSLDEIIAQQQEKTEEEADVLDLDDDTLMEDVSFEAPASNASHPKDPELSVNMRLRPDFLVERPYGMPPLLTKEAKRQLDELDKMKDENRLHELADRYGSRSTLNQSRRTSCASSMIGFGRNKMNNSFARSHRNDAIGNRSVKSVGVVPSRDLRQKLAKVLESKKAKSTIDTMESKPMVVSNNIGKLLEDKMIAQCVETISTTINNNFGRKHDMAIQKEIANLQKKPFVFVCGTARLLSEDGAGVDDTKLMAIGTKMTLNCRFS